MAISLKGLWAQVTETKDTRTPVARVTDLVAQCIAPNGAANDAYLRTELAALDAEGVFAEDAALAVLANHTDTAVVFEVLNARSPAQLVSALTPVLRAPERLREEARAPLRALVQRAVLVAPKAAPAFARDLADALLAECGHGLPDVEWRSPWATPVKKRKKAAAPALPDFDDTFHDHPSPPPDVPVGGTVDREAVARWATQKWPYVLGSMARATAVGFWKTTPPSDVRVWGDELDGLVPWLGLEVLPQTLAMIREHPAALSALAGLESPRAAPLMAAGFRKKPAERHDLARAWFLRFPRAAAIGLVPDVCAGGKTEALAFVRQQHPGAFTEALEQYDADVRDLVEERLSVPAELPARKPTLPAFLDPESMPRAVTPDRKAVAGDAHAELICLLKATPLDGAPWIDALKSTFTEASLAHLTRGLFDAWLAADAPPKERWMLHALAFFPNDGIAKDLADRAAVLAPRGLSSRAQDMVEVLAAMRTRTSLKLVHQLGRRVKSKAFRARAEQIFVTAAEKMGLTEDELAERLVSDYGLSPEGVLPVEPRTQLTLVRGKAVFVDAEGKALKALPAGADEELAELKKKATALLKETAERLEGRMVNGRRMGVDHFTEALLMHGVARRVAEGLVWGLYDGTGLAEPFVLADAGAVISKAQGKAIGVVHPLELDVAQRKSFAQRLGPQPFAQLERDNRPVANVAALRTLLGPLVNRQVATADLLKLGRLGWQRGEEVGGGCYVSYVRALPTGRVEVTFTPGIYLGNPLEEDTQVIEGIDAQLSDATPPILLSELEYALRTLLGP